MVNREFHHQASEDAIIRCARVVKHVMGRLTVANRDLVAGESLNHLENPATNLASYVEELAECEDDGEFDVDHLNELIDHLLVSASMLPVLPIRTTPEILLRATENFDDEVRSKVAHVGEQLDATRLAAAAYRDDVNSLLERTGELAATFRSNLDEQFNDLNSDVEELMGRTRGATEQLERDVTSTQEVFRESQRQREEDFAKSQNQRDNEIRNNLEPTVTEIEDFRDQAISMLEEVAGASTAEHYAKLRDKQEDAANRWRMIGFGSFLGWAVLSVGVFLFFEINGNPGDWLSILWRLGIVSPLVVTGSYCLRQSAKHRQREEDISRVANELMLLWPFMNRLPETDREALLRDITPLYFKGGLVSQSVEGESGLPDFSLKRFMPGNRAERQEK